MPANGRWDLIRCLKVNRVLDSARANLRTFCTRRLIISCSYKPRDDENATNIFLYY